MSWATWLALALLVVGSSSGLWLGARRLALTAASEGSNPSPASGDEPVADGFVQRTRTIKLVVRGPSRRLGPKWLAWLPVVGPDQLAEYDFELGALRLELWEWLCSVERLDVHARRRLAIAAVDFAAVRRFVYAGLRAGVDPVEGALGVYPPDRGALVQALDGVERELDRVLAALGASAADPYRRC